jgi:cytoskeletal protein RodZ
VGELGKQLCEARESQGISLAQAEEVTRIRRAFLQALEEERFDDLPADVYAKGFVRNYARYLGLDADALLADFGRQHHEQPLNVPHVLDEPLTRHGAAKVGWALLVSFFVVLLLGLLGWYVYNRWYLGVDLLAPFWPSARPTATLTIPTTTKPVVTPAVAATATAVEVEAQPTPTDEQANTPGPTRQQPTPLPATPTPLVTKAPSATPTATVSPTPGQYDGIVVLARITAASYVEVDIDGVRAYGGILEAGVERTWSARQTVTLLVGNAGGVALTVNGVPVPSFGANGEVVTLNYTLDTLPQP